MTDDPLDDDLQSDETESDDTDDDDFDPVPQPGNVPAPERPLFDPQGDDGEEE